MVLLVATKGLATKELVVYVIETMKKEKWRRSGGVSSLFSFSFFNHIPTQYPHGISSLILAIDCILTYFTRPHFFSIMEDIRRSPTIGKSFFQTFLFVEARRDLVWKNT